MTRIDLRFAAPIVAFYTPPFMLLTLGWLVGYPIADMREAVMIVGSMLGSVSAIVTVVFYSTAAHGPQWFYIRGGENK